MSVNLTHLWKNPGEVIVLVTSLYLVKVSLVIVLKKFFSSRSGNTRRLAIFLSPGGEFAFVLFSVAVAKHIFEPEISEVLVLVVTVSMLFAPILYLIDEKIISKKVKKTEPEYDKKYDESAVVIAGFGRFVQIIGRLLAIQKISFTALDKSSEHVEFVRRFGNKTFYGDASRLDLLHAAKVGSARLFVLAIDNIEDSLKTADSFGDIFHT